MQNKPLLTSLFVCINIFFGACFANPLTFNIDAAITQIGVTSKGVTKLYSTYDFYGKRFSLGESVFGHVSYGSGSSAIDSNGTSDSILLYSEAVRNISLTVPSALFSTDDFNYVPSLLGITDNSHNTDLLSFSASGASFTNIRVSYEDRKGTALDGFAIPLPFDPKSFTSAFADFSFVDSETGDRLFVSARIGNTEFITTAIPEPASYCLFGVGVILLLVRKRLNVRSARFSH